MLQGGTHRNMAVVKAQVDFIRGKVPDAEVVLHPYSGEAGAIGAALCAADQRDRGAGLRFRGFETIGADLHQHDRRRDRVQVVPDQLHADVHRRLPGAKGRPWSKCRWPRAGSA